MPEHFDFYGAMGVAQKCRRRRRMRIVIRRLQPDEPLEVYSRLIRLTRQVSWELHIRALRGILKNRSYHLFLALVPGMCLGVTSYWLCWLGIVILTWALMVGMPACTCCAHFWLNTSHASDLKSAKEFQNYWVNYYQNECGVEKTQTNEETSENVHTRSQYDKKHREVSLADTRQDLSHHTQDESAPKTHKLLRFEDRADMEDKTNRSRGFFVVHQVTTRRGTEQPFASVAYETLSGTSDVAIMCHMQVARTHRRQRLGHMLLHMLVIELRLLNYKQLIVYVHKTSKELRHICRKMGFRESPRRQLKWLLLVQKCSYFFDLNELRGDNSEDDLNEGEDLE